MDMDEPKLPTAGLLQKAKVNIERCKIRKDRDACRIAAEAAWGYVHATARDAAKTRLRLATSPDNEQVNQVVRGTDRRLYVAYRDMQEMLHGSCFYDGRVLACDVNVVEPLVREAETWVKEFQEKLQRGKGPSF